MNRKIIIYKRGRRVIFLLPLCLFLFFLSACGEDSFLNRRDIYTAEGGDANIEIDADWTQANYNPTGMTVMLFNDRDRKTQDETNDVSKANFTLPVSNYRLLLFNLTTSEFGSMSFYDTDSYDDIHVTLNSLSRENKSWDNGLTYVQEPERLEVSTSTIRVTQEMADRKATGDSIPTVFTVTPQSVVSRLTISIKVHGLTNLASVESSLTGMADGYMLTKGHPTTSTASHFINSWKAVPDSTGSRDGYITTTICTFGLPYEEDTRALSDRDSTANVLTLFCTMRDGKTTRTFSYNVGNIFRYVTTEGSTVYSDSPTLFLNITISDGPTMPNVDRNNGANGFDATVDNWEDGGNTDVTF